MSKVFTPIFIVVFGGLVAVAIAILTLVQLSGVGALSTQSANLVSSSTTVSGMLPIIASILVVGVLGAILSRR